MCPSTSMRRNGAILAWVLGCSLAGYAGPFAGGTGELGDPYQIATAEQLISIGSDPNLLSKCFVLTNDIDLDPNLPGGQIFTRAVIAPDVNDLGAFEGIRFTGNFEGGGHRIRHLTIRNDAAQFLSLFGCLGKAAVVRNLCIEEACVSGGAGMNLGALTGANDGRIFRCHATAHVSGHMWVGVLAGLNRGSIIECQAGGNVIGAMTTGGLVGENYRGIILNCSATTDVAATRGSDFGGLAGRNDFDAVIAHCYATGDVSAAAGDSNNLGGLVGSLQDGAINDCYACGNVSGGDNCGALGGLVGESLGYICSSYSTGRVQAGGNSGGIGGLAGYRTAGEITACFWDVGTSGLVESAGGTGLSTAQMQESGTFRAAGWDWVNERANGTAELWFIPTEGGYPMLTVHAPGFQPHELDGTGTADDPYRIATAEDLGALNHYDLTACYRLEADVDLAGITWDKAPVQHFAGQLDGAGKAVTNLRIRGGVQLGLFADLGQNASVVNLGLRNAYVTGRDVLALLAAKNQGCISACCVGGSITADSIPGLTTMSGSFLGGLTARNEGSISDSYATGNLAGTMVFGIGGLIASNGGAISRCYAAAHVSCKMPFPADCAGGLVGVNRPSGSANSIQDSYFLINTDGGGPDNGVGIPLADAPMRRQSSFSGWDFEKTWTICEGKDYPRLWWEKIECYEP
jgi:hypothetical protein